MEKGHAHHQTSQHDGQTQHEQAGLGAAMDSASAPAKHGSDGQAGDAAARRMAGHVEDLGTFDDKSPAGPKIAGKTFNLAPGGSLKFACHQNQIWGIIGCQANPAKTASCTSKLIKPMKHGDLGNTNVYQYTITMAHDAKPGDVATITTETPYQTRNDADWAFSFKVVCH